MVANPFLEWLAEVSADELAIRPDDINAEAHENLWSFSLSSEQAAAVSVADVETFAKGVADARRVWLSAREVDPMVLYWWHDELAGQLRFSLVSASHGRLPFRCPVVSARTFREIASEWLGSQHLHGIPLAELAPLVPVESVPEPVQLALPVWTVRVP
ncbi:MAG: hypothetical protein IAG10_20020 [Planctomycetaceae bacterium]|nr:hypothetical protein [Planctomycetaceae bacterium]